MLALHLTSSLGSEFYGHDWLQTCTVIKLESFDAYLLKLEIEIICRRGFQVIDIFLKKKWSFKHVPISRTFLYLQENKWHQNVFYFLHENVYSYVISFFFSIIKVLFTHVTLFARVFQYKILGYFPLTRPFSVTLTLTYYMAETASEQDESHPSLWLGTRAGEMSIFLPAAWDFPRCSRKEKYFYTSSWSTETQKGNWPISNHVDLTLGQ